MSGATSQTIDADPTKFVLALAFVLSTYWPTSACGAPPVAPLEQGEQRATLSAGWEPTWVAGMEYQIDLQRVSGIPIQAYANASFPVALLNGLKAHRWEAGGGGQLRAANGWGVATSFGLTLTRSEDALARMVAWGFDARLMPGYVGHTVSAGLDLGYVAALSTHVRHSDLVRKLFEPPDGPRDGWYWAPSHRIQLGLQGGWRASRHIIFYARGGLDYTPNRLGLFASPMYGTLPFYSRLGGGYQW